MTSVVRRAAKAATGHVLPAMNQSYWFIRCSPGTSPVRFLSQFGLKAFATIAWAPSSRSAAGSGRRMPSCAAAATTAVEITRDRRCVSRLVRLPLLHGSRRDLQAHLGRSHRGRRAAPPRGDGEPDREAFLEPDVSRTGTPQAPERSGDPPESAAPPGSAFSPT